MDLTKAKAFTAHVWDAQTGCVVEKREYKKLVNAVRYAVDTSEAMGVKEVSVTADAETIGSFINGDLMEPHVTEGNRHTTQMHRRLRNYTALCDFLGIEAHDTNAATAAEGEKTMTKTTIPAGKKKAPKKADDKPAAKKPSRAKAAVKDAPLDLDDGVTKTTRKKKAGKGRVKSERVTTKQSLEQILGMADTAIVRVDMKLRPAFPKGWKGYDASKAEKGTDKYKDLNYKDAYSRFLTGGRRTLPGSQSKGYTVEALQRMKDAVRKDLAKAAGGKATPAAKAEPKKVAAPKAAAASRRGASKVIKTTTKKRATRKKG